jgi:hypothetical protein
MFVKVISTCLSWLCQHACQGKHVCKGHVSMFVKVKYFISKGLVSVFRIKSSQHVHEVKSAMFRKVNAGHILKV